MIEDAINYPRNGEDAVKTILIGGVLSLLGFLVIPLFVVSGYYVEVLRRVMGGDDEVPPEFEDWERLLVDGLKAFVIGFVYFLIPAIVLMVTVGGTFVSIVLSGDVNPGAIAGAMLGVLVGGLLWLVAWYVLPAAVANFVREDRVGAAFAFGDLWPVLTSGTYLVAWLLAFVLAVVAGIIVSILNVIPMLGFVVGAFVNFYVGMAAAYLYGRAVADASPAEGAAEPAAGQPAA